MAKPLRAKKAEPKARSAAKGPPPAKNKRGAKTRRPKAGARKKAARKRPSAAGGAPRKRAAKRRRLLFCLGGLFLVGLGVHQIAMGVLGHHIGQAIGADCKVFGLAAPFGEAPILKGVRLKFRAIPALDLRCESLEIRGKTPRWREFKAPVESVLARRLNLRYDLAKDPGQTAAPKREVPENPKPPSPPEPASASKEPRGQRPAWIDLFPRRIEAQDSQLELRFGPRKDPMTFAVRDFNLEFSGAAGETAVRGPLRFSGRAAAGLLEGEGDLSFEPSPILHSAQLRWQDADLAQLFGGGRAEKFQLRGRLDAFLSFRIDPQTQNPVAAGWIEARRGQAFGLPPFAVLLDALGLGDAGASDFQSARILYHLENEVLHCTELVLLGTPLSLYGQGQIDLRRGRIQAAFVPRIGERELEDLPLVGEASQLLLEIAKGLLLELIVEGPLAEPSVNLRPLPFLTTPIQSFLDLFASEER